MVVDNNNPGSFRSVSIAIRRAPAHSIFRDWKHRRLYPKGEGHIASSSSSADFGDWLGFWFHCGSKDGRKRSKERGGATVGW